MCIIAAPVVVVVAVVVAAAAAAAAVLTLVVAVVNPAIFLFLFSVIFFMTIVLSSHRFHFQEKRKLLLIQESSLSSLKTLITLERDVSETFKDLSSYKDKFEVLLYKLFEASCTVQRRCIFQSSLNIMSVSKGCLFVTKWP